MEQEEENHYADWLNERYPFDAEGRNKGLEAKVLTSLSTKDQVTLVDVGAGTGSNCLYFVEQLSQNQKWYLVEQNKELRKATIKRFKEYANYYKYEFERKKDTLKISSLQKKIEVVLINDSLFKLAELVNLKKVDLVMANAVFDLFSSTQITQFLELLIQNKLPFYTTLTYEGMTFLPSDPFDDAFVDAYNAHMERTQPFGKALGIKAGKFMTQFFEEQEGQIETATSIWKVERDDIKMHYYLLNYMENALEEMKLDPSMMANFQRWTQRKKDLIITRRQSLEVRHMDLYYFIN